MHHTKNKYGCELTRHHYFDMVVDRTTKQIRYPFSVDFNLFLE